MNRLNLLRNQLLSSVCNKKKETTIINSSYDYLNFDELLTKEEISERKRLREYLEKEVTHKLPEYIQKEIVPVDIIRSIFKNFPNIANFNMNGYGMKSRSFWANVANVIELTRCDSSIISFMLVHGELVMNTIYLLGSEEQKKKYLPKLNTGEYFGCWGLTEPDYGSDASSLTTTSEEDSEGNYIINGKKRWIGNGTIADVYIVWARNKKTKQVEGYIIDKGTPGLSATKINGKLSLRMVHNSDITFDNVKIPKSNKLEKANDFQSGTNKVLLSSRLGVAWSTIAVSVGAYDRVIEYCSKRKQFGKTLTSFQLTQEKLARMMGNIQAGIYLLKRISELYLQGRMSIGKVGLGKAYVSKLSRENVALARELMGGNGILLENWVMKAFADMEAHFTYEGTYDINMLVVGAELTGVKAFK
jgi:acyl-CoA oxidase